MADRKPTETSADTAAPRRRRTGRWVLATVLLITALQVGPSLWIIFDRGIAGAFDWLGYAIFHAGSLVIPLVGGTLGLLFRPNRGLGYCVMALALFIFALIGSSFS